MWVQIIYTVVTLMAFAVILLTVHIRIGALEGEVRTLRHRLDNRRAMWPPYSHHQEDDHD